MALSLVYMAGNIYLSQKFKVMKYSKLSLAGVLTVTSFNLVTIIGCNNSNDSTKPSGTTQQTTATNDTTASANPDSTNKAAVPTHKKTGKATTTATTANTKTKMAKDKMGYYNYTEVAPVFPGGQTALETYITNSIDYPQDAIDNNVEGTISVQFAIDEDGKVSNAKAVGKKLGYGLEEEAVKIVSQMPKWTPGKVNGKNVKEWYTIPITYKIDES
jgi:protein TonB